MASSPPAAEPPATGSQKPTEPTAEPTTAEASLPIEVDVANDADSAYAESVVTDTTSLRSSILKYKWENGRRYHAELDSKYWGPNDEKQQTAEDLLHQMHRLILDGHLYQAPLSNPQLVLDVGCGTGSWAIDFADENPASEVIGVDLSPIQPSFVPPNCRFEVDDINKPWTYPENHFDFIHIRNMLGTVPNWKEFHHNAYKHVKPGGWIEQVELSSITQSDDGTLPPECALARWTGYFDEIGKKLGMTFRAAESAYDAIDGAGYTNLKQQIIKVPLGTWPKDKQLKSWGEWYRFFCIEGIEGFALRSLTDVLQWTYEEAQVFLAEMRKNLRDPHIHAYTELRVVYGQKAPEKAAE